LQGAADIQEERSVGASNIPENDSDDRVEQITQLRELIKTRRARLFQRELQAAKYGIGVDPVIPIEIDDLKREIADLEGQLKALGA
jgi:hypothetical protein